LRDHRKIEWDIVALILVHDDEPGSIKGRKFID
jgi:hypothetical protein